MTDPSSSGPPLPARRDLIRDERAARRRSRGYRRTSRWSRPSRIGSLHAATGAVAALLLLLPAGLPAYASDTVPDLAAAPPVAATQSLAVGSIAAAPVTQDSYTAMAAPAAVSPRVYAQTADTFLNNPNSDVQWPFTQGVPISSGFGYRTTPCRGCSNFHDGLDMNPGIATPVQAIAAGTVTEIGNPNGALGVYAIIDHVIDGQKIRSVYAHMLEGSLTVQVGDTVTVTQIVGRVGSSGMSTGPHLHFGLLTDGDTAIDPMAYMTRRVWK